MTLAGVPLLTDENVHRDVVEYLRSRGCDVLDVKESGLMGSLDLPLIRLAVSHNRVIVTHDPDFGMHAVVGGEPVIGIVYLRPGHIHAKSTIDSVTEVLNRYLDVTPPFIVVAQATSTGVRIRVRQLQP